MRWETLAGVKTSRQEPASTRNSPDGPWCPSLPIVVPIWVPLCQVHKTGVPWMPSIQGSAQTEMSCHGSRRDSRAGSSLAGCPHCREGRQPAALVLVPSSCRQPPPASAHCSLLLSPSPFSPCDVSVCDFLSFNQFSSQ